MQYKVWDVCLFTLKRLPCELVGVDPTWEDFRIAHTLITERRDIENSTCSECSDLGKNVTRKCPICGNKWRGSAVRGSEVVEWAEGYNERRKRFFREDDD